MEKVRFGIIGLGNQGSSYTKNLFMGGRIENGVLSAVCDNNPAKLEAIKEHVEGKNVAFDLYSMKQAIEEGFIIDVLKNYVTYKTYFELNKAIEDDPELETIAAKRKIAKYIELHDTNIAQKVEIIIEHFKNNIVILAILLSELFKICYRFICIVVSAM